MAVVAVCGAIVTVLLACSVVAEIVTRGCGLAFGDSLTFGTGAAADQSYPAQLSSLIGHEVINAGIAGDMNVPVEAAILPTVLADRALKSGRIHPNSKGYRRMAEAVVAVMQAAGAL